MEPSVVIKVQYGETLRRFSSRVVDGKFDLDMNALRKKVFSLFSFPAGSELDFTYVDEDGDMVQLADEEDLTDIMRQSLNPLRITVRLNTERSVSLRPHGRASGKSTPVRSKGLQLPLQVGNTSVSEILNSLPGTLRETVSKFSTELGLDTNSTEGYNVILDSLVKMGLTYLKEVSVAGAKSGPSEHSTDGPVTKDKNNSKSVGPTQVSKMKSLDTEQENGAGNSESFVVPATDNANSKDKSSILLENSSPKWFKDSKGHEDIGSEGKKVGKNGRSGPKTKLVKKSYESLPGWNAAMGPKPLNRNDLPFSGHPVSPYMHRHQLPLVTPPVRRSYNYSDLMGSVIHAGIQCDGCGVHPITGPRFKSKVKEDYDLCINCFYFMGIEAEYIRMDIPMNYQYQSPDPLNSCHPHFLGRSSMLLSDQCKLDSCFVLDVNILDGTIMTPLTHFTKIWRMRNNGAAAWPHGTNLVWIGGEKLSKTLSCDLKIPAEGYPLDKEIDIAVDFTAPEIPGRYLSLWRMSSPSGYKFGQRVWVLIEVGSSLKGSNSKNHHDFNLNFPPVSSGIMNLQNVNASIEPKVGDDRVDIDTPAADQGLDLPKDDLIDIDFPTLDQGIDLPNNETLLVAGANTSSAMPEAPSPVTYPVVDQSKVEPIAISVPQNSDMDVSASTTDVEQAGDEVEQTLLKELENMGFTQVDLNREILRKNEYDLEAALDELCDTDTEWDPMLVELEEMGFSNHEMNKMLLKKNNGSIKLVVMDLITGEEDA